MGRNARLAAGLGMARRLMNADRLAIFFGQFASVGTIVEFSIGIDARLRHIGQF